MKGRKGRNPMKATVLFLILTLGAVANARPFSQDMTCREARNLVRSSGAVVMNYAYHPQAGWLYDRFVSSAQYCDVGERTEAAWVPTSDDSSCFIGYVCRHWDHGHHP
jgi:hypothetical protein